MLSSPLTNVQYVEADSLKTELQRQGVQVDRPVEYLPLTFPGGRTSVTLAPTRPEKGAWPTPDTSLLLTLYQDLVVHRTYLDFSIGAAEEAGLPVWFDGWKNLQLQLGQVNLRLGIEAAPMNTYTLYAGFIGGFA